MFSLKNRQPFTIAAFDNFGLANNYRYYGILTLIFILAIISQYAVFNQGFYSVSFDESARALMSDELNLRNAIEPFVWPPVYKIFTGLVLKLYDDLFFIPRIIAFISGLLVLVELIILSDILFGDRLINIATTTLGLYLRHRFIFSIAPMSDIYFNLFILLVFSFCH